MTQKMRSQLCGWGLVLGGLMLAMCTILGNFGSQGSNGPQAAPVALIGLVGAVLVLLCIPMFYSKQADQVGLLGLLGYVLIFVSGLLLGIRSRMFAAVFFPAVSSRLGDVGNGSPAIGTFFLVSSLLLGSVLFGIAIIRAQVFPRGVGMLFIAAGVLSLGSLVSLPDIVAIVINDASSLALFLAFAWGGYALQTDAIAGSQPAPAPASPAAPAMLEISGDSSTEIVG